MSIISTDIEQAVRLLTDAQLVAIPTETVYGLAGNIYSEKAIHRIFSTKKRPFFNPLIVHIPTVKALEKIVTHIPEKAKLLAAAFWPGSLTLVLKKNSTVPDIITAGKDTVAVRIPNHPVTLALLAKLPFPLAAPSANPFGSISPTKAAHVEAYFKNDIQMILDGGSCANGIESTIIGFENETPILYRLGALTLEDIEAVVGKITIKNKEEESPEAPGMLARHYAPKTSTFLVHDVAAEIKKHAGKKIGVLVFKTTLNTPDIVEIILSKNGSMQEAASNLYTAMHALDAQQLDVIIAEKFPEFGLGKSMNDRLQRATFK
ncbi:L-threonylcarbamoyladenylate synthase [uncultured Polaribacter sp.]|uniref:L-threonylcarbamoyladenylate synthase n=1 Tax=uncultured Polaribacter sp. TaxID=174711 RepID=UPI000ABA5FD4|nr:threonylcarbamoyl-AMP synthase [Polaribacter sp.]|tara:strand:- start:4952 stop:5908 length:957 start_codon:yes stop_codon:yes gene_type:complete